MKKRTLIFSLLFFLIVSFCGCSNNTISKVEVMDKAIKTNYIIGEEFQITDFALKITFTNNHEKIYNITQNMVTYGNVNNMITDIQNINLTVNYKGMEIDFILSVKYDLPQEVTLLNQLIENLLEVKDLSFKDEEAINLINKNYSNLEKIYIPYIEGYEAFLRVKDELDALKNKYITPDFINKRFILKTNLDNFFNSLNKNDYSNENWATLLNIYDVSISALYLDENHDKVDLIVTDAINSMKKVTTLAQDKLSKLKAEKINEIIQILFTYDASLYSYNNYFSLNNVVEEFIKGIDGIKSIDELLYSYTHAIHRLNNVETIEQEKISSLSYTKNIVLNSLNEYFTNLNLSLYTSQNQSIISKLYDYYSNSIENAGSEDAAKEEFIRFKYDVSCVKTHEQQQKERLIKVIDITIASLKEFYSNINMYQYDTTNRYLIEAKVNEVINKLAHQSNETEVYNLKNEAIEYINNIPTMVEQAVLLLPTRINQAREKLDNYLNSFNKTLYSKENWSLIIDITNNYKEYLQNNVTIYTSNMEINNIVERYRDEVALIKTIEEEFAILLEETKITAISELESYFSSFSENDFLPKVYDFCKEKINESIHRIENEKDISNISKILNETISLINDIKK